MNEVLFAAIVLARLAGPTAPTPAGVQTLTIRQAVERAVALAPEVAVARSAAETAAQDWNRVRSERRPQFFASTTPGYSTGVPLSVAGEVPAAVEARFRMALYDPSQRGDELEALAHASTGSANVDGARVEAARRTLIAAARLRADETRAASAAKRVEAWGTILRRDRALATEGRLTDLDVERVALEEARARQALFAAESDRDLDRFELARLVGLPSGSAVAIGDDPADAAPAPAPGDTVALAQGRDPQLRALQKQSDALAQSAALLSRAFRPVVNAEARYAYVPRLFGYDKYYLKFQENVAAVGVSLALPVWTGGRQDAQAARARARVAEVEARKALREGEIVREARLAESLHERAGLEAGLARRAVALADAALRQTQAVAREGRGAVDDPEKAQIDLSDAEEKLARASQEQIEARTRLLALRGELLSALGLEESTGP